MSLEKEVNKTATATAQAKKTAAASKKEYTPEEISSVLQSPAAQAAIQQMIAEALKNQQPVQPQIVQVSTEEPMITLLYMGSVAPGAVVDLGDKIGTIMGHGGTKDVPKKLFLQNLTTNILRRLKDRRLVVLAGLSDEERSRYGLDYAEGELAPADIYEKLLGYNEKTVVDIFSKACYRHKQLIATLYIDAYIAHDNRVNQPLIQKLQEISKTVDSDGMFTSILKDMARNLADA